MFLFSQDDLCKNVFALLNSERLSLFLDAVRVSYLLFESLRSHLKLQMERYFLKLAQLVTAEPASAGTPSSPKERYVSFEQKVIVKYKVTVSSAYLTAVVFESTCVIICCIFLSVSLSAPFSTHLLSHNLCNLISPFLLLSRISVFLRVRAFFFSLGNGPGVHRFSLAFTRFGA